MKGILGYTEDDVVSTDFIGDNRYGWLLFVLGFVFLVCFFLVVYSHSEYELTWMCNLLCCSCFHNPQQSIQMF